MPHQANLRIIEATAKHANIPMSKVMVNVDRYGNTSAASIPLALAQAEEEGRLKPGMLILLGGVRRRLHLGSNGRPVVTVLLCPGQGAQKVGMGKDLAERFPAARDTFAAIDDALGVPLSRLMWEGPEEELTLTHNAQPAILAHTCAVLVGRRRQRSAPSSRPPGTAWASTARTSRPGPSPPPMVARLVRRRGELMLEAGKARAGAMAAVIGLGTAEVAAACEGASSSGEVAVPANLNAPDQTVISGDPAAVTRAGEACKAAGAKRVLPLKVSGAFHSPLMAPAVPGLAAALEAAAFGTPRFPVIANATAIPSRDVAARARAPRGAGRRRRCAGWSACRPVRLDHPRARFLEIGPGQRADRAPQAHRAGDHRHHARHRRRSREVPRRMTTIDLAGKVAFVTGSTRGIGLAIAKALHAAGAKVAIIGRDAARAREAAASLGAGTVGVACESPTPPRSTAAIAAAEQALGPIDILVNNAGLTRDNILLRLSEADWDAVLDANLKGAFLTMRAVTKGMMKRRSGRIINITSIVGIIGNKGQANYAASKAGLIGLTKSAAKEYASRGILINCIAPGFIDTDMTAALPEDARKVLLEQIALGRLGSARRHRGHGALSCVRPGGLRDGAGAGG